MTAQRDNAVSLQYIGTSSNVDMLAYYTVEISIFYVVVTFIQRLGKTLCVVCQGRGERGGERESLLVKMGEGRNSWRVWPSIAAEVSLSHCVVVLLSPDH